jgi:hypothetical protein
MCTQWWRLLITFFRNNSAHLDKLDILTEFWPLDWLNPWNVRHPMDIQCTYIDGYSGCPLDCRNHIQRSAGLSSAEWKYGYPNDIQWMSSWTFFGCTYDVHCMSIYGCCLPYLAPLLFNFIFSMHFVLLWCFINKLRMTIKKTSRLMILLTNSF